MDIRKIQRLIQLLKGTDITELEVTEGELRIRLSRQQQIISHPIAAAPVAQPVAVEPTVVAPESQAKQEAAERVGHMIKAPMVGTFYRASSPGAEPFVGEGDTVKVGQTLCIIEAMKLMNEIESDMEGRIREIYVENGQPVEYGEPLFLIEPL